VTPSVFERHPKTTLIAVVVAAAALLDVGAGLLLRRSDPSGFRRAHPYYHHGLIANRSAWSQWGHGELYPVFTNSLGMFDASVREVPLRPDRPRIVVIGDSFTEGIGLPWPQTFVGMLAERIGPERAEILNAAEISYSPKLYLLKIEYLLEHVGLEFDHLVVMIDISDVQDEVLYAHFEPRPEPERPPASERVRAVLDRFSYGFHALDRLLRQRERDARRSRYTTEAFPPWLDYFWLDDINLEAVADPAFPHLRHEWTQPEWTYHRFTREGVDSALAHMESLVRLCRRHGIEPTLVVYPWITQIQKRDLASRQVTIWSHFARRHGVAFVDLFPLFIGDTPFAEVYARYFIAGDTHWNPEGHRLVADALLPIFARAAEGG
jgi:hypothetical protein